MSPVIESMIEQRTRRAVTFAQAIEHLREILNTLEGFDGNRHVAGLSMKFEDERILLRQEIAFLEHVRVYGFQPPVFGGAA